jgi:hypothetical protein
VVPKPELRNAPLQLNLPDLVPNPATEKLNPEQFQEFVKYTSSTIAEILDLKKLQQGKRKAE